MCTSFYQDYSTSISSVLEMRIELGWIGALGTLKETDTYTMFIGITLLSWHQFVLKSVRVSIFCLFFGRGRLTALATDTDIKLLSIGQHITARATGR